VIGVRSKVIDSNIRAGTATESFVQIIHVYPSLINYNKL
jgi:hypothetical protein